MRSAAKRAMTEPSQKIFRDRQFNVAVTSDELALLQRRAAAAGMRPVDYGRARLFAEWKVAARHAEHAHHLDPLLIAHLSRIGNNLNQVARLMNTFQRPAPAGLPELLDEIRALIRRATPP